MRVLRSISPMDGGIAESGKAPKQVGMALFVTPVPVEFHQLASERWSDLHVAHTAETEKTGVSPALGGIELDEWPQEFGQF